MRNQLSQRFCTIQSQEHVEEIPVRSVELGHCNNDEGGEECQESRSGERGKRLGGMIQCRVVVSILDFLIHDSAFNYRKWEDRNRHENKECHTVEQKRDAALNRRVRGTVSEIPEKRTDDDGKHNIHGDAGAKNSRVEEQVREVPTDKLDQGGQSSPARRFNFLLELDHRRATTSSMLKTSHLIIVNVLDRHLDVLDGLLDPGLLWMATAPGIKVGGPSFGVFGVKTKVVINGGYVMVGGVKVGWRRLLAV